MENNDFKGTSIEDNVPEPKYSTLPHYYGDLIRKLFLTAAIILLVTLPFLRGRISLSIFASVIVILILTFSAGITNPRQKFIALADTIISVFGFALFAYDAIRKYDHTFDLLFITNLTLAGIFLFAFYLCTKTSRGAPVFMPKAQRLEKEEIERGKNPKNEGVPTNTKQSLPLTEEEIRKKRFLNQE